MVKYVLVPSKVRYDIEKELSYTFQDDEDSLEIINLYGDVVVRDYTNPVEVAMLIGEFEDRITKLQDSNAEVYLIASGSAFHTGLAVKMLMEYNVPFKFLVYEKKKGRYAVI